MESELRSTNLKQSTISHLLFFVRYKIFIFMGFLAHVFVVRSSWMHFVEEYIIFYTTSPSQLELFMVVWTWLITERRGGCCYSFMKIKWPGIYKYIFQNSHKITYIFMILQNKINAVGIPRVKNVDVDKNN